MATDINKDVGIAIKGDTTDFNNKIKGAGDKASQFGDKAKQAGDKAKSGMDKASQGADTAKIKFGVAAVAIQGFTTQIAGMGQQILDFNSKIIALQKTMVGLESQQIALTRAQEDLAKAVREGTIEERDYHRALEDIELQYKNMVLESKNVEAENKKLSGEFVSFGIQGVSAVTQVGLGLAALHSTNAWGGIVSNISSVGGALWKIAKHPVFLIISAGILAWELGLKSIVENLTGIDDLGVFSNIQKAFEGLTEGENSMEELNKQTKEFGDTVEKNLPVWGSEAKALDKIGDSAEKTSKKIKGLTVAQEMLMRSGNFRAGGGTSLSQAIGREADDITAATARTLAAASLHEALKQSGITGSVFSRNISGDNSRGLVNFLSSIDRDDPILGGQSGLGPDGTGLFGAESTGKIQGYSPAERFFRGPKQGSFADSRNVSGITLGGGTSSFAGRSLTRSKARRRSGRNRNPLGRFDRFSGFKQQAVAAMDKKHADLFSVVGGTSVNVGDFRSRRFSGNNNFSKQDMQNILQNDFDAHLQRMLKAAQDRFVDMKKQQGVNDIPMEPAEYARLQVIPGSFKEIKGVIDFQKRTSQAVTGVTI